MDCHYGPNIVPHREFTWESQDVCLDGEDVSFIDKIEELEAGESSCSPLDLFLDIPVHSPRRFYEQQELQALCPDTTLRSLRSGFRKLPPDRVVWMDDRSKDNDVRHYNGLMSMGHWLENLKRKRFGETDLPDVDTRRIHIPNPDSQTIGGLILGASNAQIPVFRSLLCRHLEADGSIRVYFNPGGRVFTLEFHLPHFVMRNEAWHDTRRKANGSPLRSTKDLSFLTKPDQNKICLRSGQRYLYEAQSSCVVTGHNNNSWTACSLADTYFYGNQASEANEENEDMLPYYEGEPWDPLTMGVRDANKPTTDPREYFLAVFHKRLDQVKEEWQNIAYSLREGIVSYLKEPHIATPPRKPSLGFAEAQSEAIRSSYDWIKEVNALLMELNIAFSKVVHARKSFEKTDMFYFTGPGASKQAILLLHEVCKTFQELENVQGRFKYIEDLANNFKKQLELYLQVEGSGSIVLQQWSVTILQVMSPPGLAAAMMQSGIISFQPLFVCFAVLTFVVGTMSWAVQPLLTRYRGYKLLTQELDSNGSPGFQDYTVPQEYPWGSQAILRPKRALFRPTTSYANQ